MLEGPGEDSSMRASLLANDGANEEEDEAQEEERGGMSTPGKYAVSIVAGIAFGISLNLLKASSGVVTLSTVTGNLFLRALQCAVIPMMFFNITCSVVDIFGSGNAGSLGGKAIYFYSLTTILAVCEGILTANLFSFLFGSDEGESDDDDGVEVGMACPENFGTLTMEQDGSIICIHEDQLSSLNLSSDNQLFYLQDKDDKLVNGVLLKTTLVQQILSTFYSLVPNNITESFAIPNIISIIIIAFVLGAAIVVAQANAVSKRRGVSPIGSETVLAFSKEMANISNIIIGWVIDFAPYCIGFLVANSLAGAGNILDLVRTVGLYVCSVLSGIVLHLLVVLPLVFFYETRGENPYAWMYEIRNPLIVAFSTESSAATLPISIQTALDSGKIEEKVANTILPMGATINMDGSAIGYPCAVAFLAHTAKLEDKLTIIAWINIALGSTLGSAGAAPVPNAGVVMLITVWETALPGFSVPDAIAYVQAIEFFVARFQTACNVCSDMFIIRMIQAGIDREKKLV